MTNDKFTVNITEYDDGERVDKLLSALINDMSRTYIQKLIKDGLVLVNDKTVKPNYRLAEGDYVSVDIPEPVLPHIEPENIPIDIVYEDDDILIVNKEKGMVVHPAPGHYTQTLVNALLYHCKSDLSGINGVLRPGIVHRIDKDTSGLLVICKNNNAHMKIAAQLAEHSITRTYHAIAYGNIKEDNGTIDKPIKRDKVDRKRMAVDLSGKEAITHYKVIERYNFKNNPLTYIQCNLETGRTHQIRVHMAYNKHPLVGDMVYGPAKQIFNTNGQVLHAKILGFIHPTTGKYIEFDSELPEYFTKLIEIIK